MNIRRILPLIKSPPDPDPDPGHTTTTAERAANIAELQRWINGCTLHPHTHKTRLKCRECAPRLVPIAQIRNDQVRADNEERHQLHATPQDTEA